MRLIITLLLLGLLVSPPLTMASNDVSAAPGLSGAPSSPTIDLLLERAIAQNLIAGGVVVVGNRDGIVSTSAKGELNPVPGSPLLTERTVFDVASLTKVIATAPAVMKLVDEGRIGLTDPVSRWLPEFAGSELTILHLLTHTSGLQDVSVSSQQSMPSTIRKAAGQRRLPGTSFLYADINFILLGEVVQRETGQTLDAFCREQIYAPIGAQETMFLPPRELASFIAPTSGTSGGVVQDHNARRLGGVAGHAGLFSSAYDLAKYARLMLGGGMLDDRRILSEQAVAQMTTPYLCNNGRVLRGLGWDIESPYSAPRGNFFSNASFGHTGYSGSSIWIDPQQDLFVILLTRRSNYSDVRSFNQLRRDVSTIAVADVRMPDAVPALVESMQAAKPAPKPVQVAAGKPASRAKPKTVAVARATTRYQQRAQHRAPRVERVAKVGSGRRAARVTSVARVARASKAEACKTTPAKKKKRAPKG